MDFQELKVQFLKKKHRNPGFDSNSPAGTQQLLIYTGFKIFTEKSREE
jgi:hypothetical protein